MKVNTVDSITLAYLERVSGKKGQHAVEAWVRYTGWSDDGKLRSEDERLQRVVLNARKAVPR